jgi:CHASE3 domain sensor protein
MTVSSPNSGFLGNLKIGTKLTIGLALLAFLTLLVVVIGYGGSATATQKINVTTDVGMPTTLASSRAQADLLRMLGDVRGYLALGEADYRTGYDRSSQAFRADLANLKALSASFDPTNQKRLQTLEDAFGQWSKLTDQLFDLRDDQQAREPAYNMLVTDGAQHAGAVLDDIGKLIDAQGLREPTGENSRLLTQMAKFQGSFAAMFSGLRDFTITRDADFRNEYQASLDANTAVWENLIASRSSLAPAQQAVLDDIAANREAFLALPDQMFAILASPSWRLDLFAFTTVAVPAADSMLTELDQITATQQDLLRKDLSQGRTDLAAARLQTLAGGGLAAILSIVLALILGNNIAGSSGCPGSAGPRRIAGRNRRAGRHLQQHDPTATTDAASAQERKEAGR